MSNPIIKVEHLSKKYILKHQNEEPYTTLRDVISNKVKSVFKQPAIGGLSAKEDFWALNDVSFEINQGDRVGIIGRNGAGKSTLLKVLSRIVSPTKGKITLDGRVASLLEVGTGFHPELTGRENIFLNGSILGMSKKEIQNKFEEIVEFSGVSQFLDTPVKRYSSGMYVRLAFSIAAHLEPDILIVDEVLAVGDAEFQKKCLGKMKDITGEGRTLLFVSHDMAAVKSLVNNCFLFEKGQVARQSENVNSLINDYLFGTNQNKRTSWTGIECGNEYVEHLSSEIKNASGLSTPDYLNGEDIFIEIKIKVKIPSESLVVSFTLKNASEQQLMRAYFDDYKPGLKLGKGSYKIIFKIPKFTLASGEYKICFDIAIHNYQKVSDENSDLYFNVLTKSELGNRFNFVESILSNSIIRPNICEDIITL